MAKVNDKTDEPKVWYVYMLRCSDSSLYTGITTDLSRRIDQHNAGSASKYTRSRLPVVLEYQEEQPTKSMALKRELVIKALTRKAKEELIDTEKRKKERTSFIRTTLIEFFKSITQQPSEETTRPRSVRSRGSIEAQPRRNQPLYQAIRGIHQFGCMISTGKMRRLLSVFLNRNRIHICSKPSVH